MHKMINFTQAQDEEIHGSEITGPEYTLNHIDDDGLTHSLRLNGKETVTTKRLNT